MTAEERWELPEVIGPPEASTGRLWAVDGRLTADSVAGAERLPGRFATAGLVDSHFHMALRFGGIAVGLDEAVEALRNARDEGVLLVRDMGAPGGISLKLPADPLLPRVISSGKQLAVAGRFFEASHDPVTPEHLVDAALAEIAAGATWVKVLTDWQPDDPLSYPMPVLRDMVAAVHAAGGRVAAHCSWFVHDVLMTGVDSIEHGTLMDEASLRLMAERGVAWAPTTNFLVHNLAEMARSLAGEVTDERRAQLENGRGRVAKLLDGLEASVQLAARLGVRLLASTDSAGSVAEEVERWAGWGVPAETAVGAAIWDSRRFLGAEGLTKGAPADVVTFDSDPRIEPAVLHRPVTILLRGRRMA